MSWEELQEVSGTEILPTYHVFFERDDRKTSNPHEWANWPHYRPRKIELDQDPSKRKLEELLWDRKKGQISEFLELIDKINKEVKANEARKKEHFPKGVRNFRKIVFNLS